MVYDDRKDEYLTRNESADYVGVSPRTIDRYANQGRLTRYRRGFLRGIYFKKDELASVFELRPQQDEED